MVSLILIRWIVIYPVDSAIQRLNNWGQVCNCRGSDHVSSGPYGKFADVITATLSLQKRLQSFARGSNYIALTITRGGSNVISTNGLVPIPLSKEEGEHQGKMKER